MDKKRKMMLMNMTDKEIWLSQFDERDFEASQILLDLQRQPPLPSPSPPPPELKERTPFLVVWGRKKRLVSRTRRVSRGLSCTTTLASPTTPLTHGQPTSSESEDSYCPNKRRELLDESAALQKRDPEIKNGFCPHTTPLTNGQPMNKRRKLLSGLRVQNSNSQIYSSLIDGPQKMGSLRVQPKKEMAQYEQARAREARMLRKMKIQQRKHTKKMLMY